MTIEVALVISGLSLAFAVYQGITNLKRNSKHDAKHDATEMTTVIVKLENISSNIAEIKNDFSNTKNDIKGISERLIVAEQSSKQAHKRLDGFEKRLLIIESAEEQKG
ncbi:MAG: hypothetical protein LUG13_01775 [Oscillospiraceae bacterium]|nr:hypothetical protein [Oscillospiraceae bacterium]